ncbi:unnamed protein product [Diamesa serratosioi]
MNCPVCNRMNCVCIKTSYIELPMKSTLSPDVKPYPDSDKSIRKTSVNIPKSLMRNDNQSTPSLNEAVTKVESLFVPEKKLNKIPPRSKEDLSTKQLRSSEIKHLEQITTNKNNSQHSIQLAQKVSVLLSQQHKAQPPLAKESIRNNRESKMGQDCGSCIAKYILCLFNFIFFILGSLVLALGIWLLADKNSIISLLRSVNSEHVERFTEPQLIDQSVYILIAIGGLMFLLGFLGYCGAIRESQCMLSLYGVCLIIILVLEVIVVVFAILYKDVARDETKQFLVKTVKEYQSSAKETDAVTLMWNQLMAQFKCCGVEDYKDFETSSFWLENKGNRTIPEACCVLAEKALLKPLDQSCVYTPSETNSYFEQGCYKNLMDYLQTNRNIVMGVGAGLGIVQLFAIFLAFCLCKTINHYRSSSRL